MKTLTQYQPSYAQKRWLVIITVMLVAILEVLDSTIVNVALPHMMPALNANQEQITWVLTSYVVASAMMIPLTGYFSQTLGYRRLLLINVSGFMVSSLLCGISGSLTSMVIYRLLQGAFGAALIPMSQAILKETFSDEEQSRAMAIWGIGIMAAPIFGPTLGGFITDHSSWRWLFYLNLPFCLIGLSLICLVIKPKKIQSKRIDISGVIALFTAIGTLQLILDQGNSKDWFSSYLIQGLTAITLLSFSLFMYRSFTAKQPVINLSIFKHRNFSLCTLALAILASGLFGTITMEPLLLENLLQYTPMQAGITMIPLGLFSAVGMMSASIILKRIKPHRLLMFSPIPCMVGAHLLAGLNIHVTQINFLPGNALLGLGMGLSMVPISTIALMSLEKHLITEGSGLFSYGRLLGTSIGIALLSTLLSREVQINWHQLINHITHYSLGLQYWINATGFNLSNPVTPFILKKAVLQQATMISFLDVFRAVSYGFMLLIPIVIFIRSPEVDHQNGVAQ